MAESSPNNIKVDDVSIDEKGRVVISNPTLAERVKKLSGISTIQPDDFNVGCTANTGCGKKLE